VKGHCSEQVLNALYFTCKSKPGQQFALPFADKTFDTVIIPSLIRNVSPIGDFLLSENVKKERMSVLLKEVARILKAEGEVVCADGAQSALLIWADLRDAGFSSQITETSHDYGHVFLFKSKCLKERVIFQIRMKL
jgi:ubiquinone/menaquinone biosynthesis C-methylase UbiE